MSILKSTNSGKTLYWVKVLEQNKYLHERVSGNIGLTEYNNCFKYPFTKEESDCFFLTRNNDLIAYIKSGVNSYFVKIQDIKQLELCEWYWESKHNSIFGENSKIKTEELAYEIIHYEHS